MVNHDYADGDAAAVNSVLQAGTPVLVDATGTPRVRCSGASPLAVPDGAGYPDFVLLGTPRAGYLVDEVLVNNQPLRSPPCRWSTRPAASSWGPGNRYIVCGWAVRVGPGHRHNDTRTGTGSLGCTTDRRVANGSRRVPGDLGLSVAMTRPACDGSGIVVVASAVSPGSYTATRSTEPE